MEIPSWCFFSFCALVSIIFLHLGFYSLDRTELSNSVSPIIMSVFKHSLAISSCCSSSYALVFRSQSICYNDVVKRHFWAYFGSFAVLCYSTIDEPYTSLWGVLLYTLMMSFARLLHLPKLKFFAESNVLIIPALFYQSSWFPWYFPILTLMNFFLITGDTHVKTCLGIHMAVETSLCFVSGKHTLFFPYLVMYASFFISAFWAALSGFEPYMRDSGDRLFRSEHFTEMLPVAKKVKELLSTLKEMIMGKLFEFAIGLVGTILFQNFFRLTSFSHVMAFLYLGVAWVANLAMLGVSSDFGILNFILGNVVVGCTVSQFALRSTTWIVSGASLFLYGLRLKLESWTLLNGQSQSIHISLDRSNLPF